MTIRESFLRVRLAWGDFVVALGEVLSETGVRIVDETRDALVEEIRSQYR